MSEEERAREVAWGDWLHDLAGNIRVMGVIDGYVMLRRPHALPFVISLRDLRNGVATRGGACGPIKFGRLAASHLKDQEP